MNQGIVRPSTGEVIARRVYLAHSFAQRTRGLLARPQLTEGEALIIERARQVHTIGMRYAIDVVFCDKDWRIGHVVYGMRPGRLTRWVLRCRYVVELPAGTAPKDLRRGEVLDIREIPTGLSS